MTDLNYNHHLGLPVHEPYILFTIVTVIITTDYTHISQVRNYNALADPGVLR